MAKQYRSRPGTKEARVGPEEKRRNRDDDAIRRQMQRLIPDPERGCQMYPRLNKTNICGKPVVEIVAGKVAVCQDCLDKAQRIAAESREHEERQIARRQKSA